MKGFLIIASLLGVTACTQASQGDPTNTDEEYVASDALAKIMVPKNLEDKEAGEKFAKEIKASGISEDETKMVMAYVLRREMASAFGQTDIPEVSVAEAIENQRQFIAKQNGTEVAGQDEKPVELKEISNRQLEAAKKDLSECYDNWNGLDGEYPSAVGVTLYCSNANQKISDKIDLQECTDATYYAARYGEAFEADENSNKLGMTYDKVGATKAEIEPMFDACQAELAAM